MSGGDIAVVAGVVSLVTFALGLLALALLTPVQEQDYRPRLSTADLWTLYVDFNAQDEDGSVRLGNKDATEVLQELEGTYDVRPGDAVWLTDGELSVRAYLQRRLGYDARPHWVATPDWSTMIDHELERSITCS